MVIAWLGVLVLLKGVTASVIPSGRIVNGVNASHGEAPYVVSVRYNNCHECGGSIIGDRWVLTAAHCVFTEYVYTIKKPATISTAIPRYMARMWRRLCTLHSQNILAGLFVNVLTILYGTRDIQNCLAPREYTMKAKKAYVNSDYQPYGGYFNDIAVIEMEESFVFDQNASPVKLPHQDDPSPILKDSLLFGWGYSHVDGTVADILQKVDISIYPVATCEMFFSSNFSETSHICAGGDGKGQCTGDSGSALTVDGIQYGIVSWSDKPCATTPGVMTRVASFRNWIANITGI